MRAGGELTARSDERPQAVAPRDGARAGDGESLGVVEDDAADTPGHLFDDDVRCDAHQFAQKRTPFLGRDRLVTTPVDNRRRHARGM